MDLIICYKIIRGLVLVSADRFFSLICSLRTPGHSYKLFLPDFRINCTQRFIAVRIVNSIPEDIVSADHLSLFVRLLNNVDLSQFLIGKA